MPIEGAMGGNRLLATGINSRWHAVNRNRSLLEMASLILAVRSAVRLATTECGVIAICKLVPETVEAKGG